MKKQSLYFNGVKPETTKTIRELALASKLPLAKVLDSIADAIKEGNITVTLKAETVKKKK